MTNLLRTLFHQSISGFCAPLFCLTMLVSGVALSAPPSESLVGFDQYAPETERPFALLLIDSIGDIIDVSDLNPRPFTEATWNRGDLQRPHGEAGFKYGLLRITARGLIEKKLWGETKWTLAPLQLNDEAKTRGPFSLVQIDGNGNYLLRPKDLNKPSLLFTREEKLISLVDQDGTPFKKYLPDPASSGAVVIDSNHKLWRVRPTAEGLVRLPGEAETTSTKC